MNHYEPALTAIRSALASVNDDEFAEFYLQAFRTLEKALAERDFMWSQGKILRTDSVVFRALGTEGSEKEDIGVS